MKKKELLARIEALEQRVRLMEARPGIVWTQTTPGVMSPTIFPQAPYTVPETPLRPSRIEITCSSGDAVASAEMVRQHFARATARNA